MNLNRPQVGEAEPQQPLSPIMRDVFRAGLLGNVLWLGYEVEQIVTEGEHHSAALEVWPISAAGAVYCAYKLVQDRRARQARSANREVSDHHG